MIKHTKIENEPLNKINNIINCVLNKDIKIGIIDIDEEGQKFDKKKIKQFYDNIKIFLKSLNILVVCSQRSLSLGTTQHFQHLLKEVIEEETNTNFNTKNNNKKNTTQVIPFKIFSSISGSKLGLRTRVYTQGLDNDKLKVNFDSIDFSLTSSNEGAILCSIKYDEKDLISVLNLYTDLKNNNNNDSNKIKDIKTKIYKKFNILLDDEKIRLKETVYSAGKSNQIFNETGKINENIIYIKINKDLNKYKSILSKNY